MEFRHIERVKKTAKCPFCGTASARHSLGTRTIRDTDGPVVVAYSKHRCPRCRKCFSIGVPELAKKAGRYSRAVEERAVGLVRGGRPLAAVAEAFGVPVSTVHEWVMASRVRCLSSP